MSAWPDGCKNCGEERLHLSESCEKTETQRRESPFSVSCSASSPSRVGVGLALALFLWPANSICQELEPRAYSVSPVKTNFLVVSNAYAAGDLAFDPSLPVEEASANINTMVAGYFRSVRPRTVW